MMPYPNTMVLWPQFRSPLVWDVFAVSTYATVSLLFWFVGLIPDLATLRDRAKNRASKVVYGILAMGWRGSAVHWHRYETASLLLAGLATPLVVSVHTVVSFDFAVALMPGLAHHDFSSVLCRGRDLFRICDGHDAGDSHPQILWAGRFHHHAPLGKHGESDAGDGIDRRVRLHDGNVWRRFTAATQYEKYMFAEPLVGPYCVFLLAADSVQHRDSANDVV